MSGLSASDDTHGVQPLRVVVVDADERTRESIVGLLAIRGRFRVVGSAGQLAPALALTEQLRPDVVVVDPRLPEVTGGLALIHRVRELDPGIRILALGWSPELEHDALAAGADGFVRKTFKPAELADAIGRCVGSNGSAQEPDPSAAPEPVPGTGLIL